MKEDGGRWYTRERARYRPPIRAIRGHWSDFERKGWLYDTHTTRSHSLPPPIVSFDLAEIGEGWVQSCRSQWSLSERRGESFGPWVSTLLPGGWVTPLPPPQCEASLTWTLRPLLGIFWEFVLCYFWNKARGTTDNIARKPYPDYKTNWTLTALLPQPVPERQVND